MGTSWHHGGGTSDWGEMHRSARGGVQATRCGWEIGGVQASFRLIEGAFVTHAGPA
jgi:hypothetical protein